MTMARNSRVLRTIPLLIAVCLLSFPAHAKYSGGTGEPNDPYQVATAEDLMLLGDSPEDYDKHFVMTADIDLDPNLPGRKVFNKAVIAPAEVSRSGGLLGTPFTGVFDGNFHTISHLTITGTQHLGLFGSLKSGAKVKNLGVVDVNITASGSYVGGLVGRNSAYITASYSIGLVIGNSEVGGLVGLNAGNITLSHSSGIVSGTSVDVGGLVGQNTGRITTSYSSSVVNGNNVVGGLVGKNDIGRVTMSYSTGKVTGNEDVGGLVGWDTWHFSSDITLSVWDIETSGINVSDGGVGLRSAQMMDPNMLGLNGFANDPNWVLNSGGDYPRLAWEGTPGQVIPEPSIDWLTGEGTPEAPYRIDTADQLIVLGKASVLWDKCFVLDADIDLDPNLPGRCVFGQAVIPTFTGVFDGNAHTISHLTIKGKGYLGLFGQLGLTANISNLGLEAVDIYGSGDYVSGLAGYNSGRIATSYSTGIVMGNIWVGGLTGCNDGIESNSGIVTTSYSQATVSGTFGIGGLVGRNFLGGIVDSYSTGTINGDRSVGGLMGWDSGGTTSSFWDIETSGQVTSPAGTGLTTAEMQTASTFLEAGWDFVDETANGTDDIWWILEGQDYPRLWWELIPEN